MHLEFAIEASVSYLHLDEKIGWNVECRKSFSLSVFVL